MDGSGDVREDGGAFGAGFDEESLAGYIVDEAARAFGQHDAAAPGSVQRLLSLGELLALFNLADQFGLLDRVRADLGRRLGRDAYLAFSEAMKAALLDRGGTPAPRDAAPRPARPPDRRPPRGGEAGGRRGG